MKKTIRIFLAIIIITTIAFLANGFFNGEIEYEFEVEIDAPQKHCWAEYQFPGNLKHWISGFKKIEMIDGGIAEVGSVYKISFEIEGNEEFFLEEIMKINPLEELEFEIKNDKVIGQIAIQLTEGSKTTLRYKAKLEGRNIFWKSIMALSGDRIEEIDSQNYLQLKELIEKSWLKKKDSPATQLMGFYREMLIDEK